MCLQCIRKLADNVFARLKFGRDRVNVRKRIGESVYPTVALPPDSLNEKIDSLRIGRRELQEGHGNRPETGQVATFLPCVLQKGIDTPQSIISVIRDLKCVLLNPEDALPEFHEEIDGLIIVDVMSHIRETLN